MNRQTAWSGPERQPRPARRRAYRWGLLGEGVAAALLSLKGYKILGRRVKTPVGEIDIVARRGTTLVFVEVKLRRTLAGALDAVHEKNRSRIVRAAHYYMAGRPRHAASDLRFDVIALAPPLFVRHIMGAW